MSLFCSNSFGELPEQVVRRLEPKMTRLITEWSRYSPAHQDLVIDKYAKLVLREFPNDRDHLKPEEVSLYLREKLSQLKDIPETDSILARLLSDHSFIKDKVKTLIQAYGGRMHADRLYLNLPCQGHRYEVPLEIEATEDVFGLSIVGFTPEADLDRSRCLELSVESERLHVGRVSAIDVHRYACPIPQEITGTCLLGFAEELSQTLSLSQMSLYDLSKVKCEKNGKMVDFRLLRIFAQKKTWYEKHGYEAAYEKGNAERRKKLEEYPLVAFLQNIEALLNFADDPLADDIELFENAYSERPMLQKFANRSLIHARKEFTLARIKAIPALKDLNALMTEEVPLFQKESQGKQLGEFMTWLWNKDCSKYSDINLMPRLNPYHPLEISSYLDLDWTVYKKLKLNH